MQLAFPDAVYLVDAIEGDAVLMQACKPALESSFVTKVVHDCKRDSEVSSRKSLFPDLKWYLFWSACGILFFVGIIFSTWDQTTQCHGHSGEHWYDYVDIYFREYYYHISVEWLISLLPELLSERNTRHFVPKNN